jgi:hypothetical protein
MVNHILDRGDDKFYQPIFWALVAVFIVSSRVLALPQFASDETAVLQESKPLVTRAGAWQSWHDSLSLKPGQEKLPLMLTFVNGADGRPKFTDLRVELSRKPFTSLQEFAGADSKSFDLTGKITQGSNPLVVQGFGPSGARLIWKLITIKPVITAINPNPIRPVDKVRIQGKNFPEQKTDMQVLFDKTAVKVLSTKANEVELEVPHHLHGGKHDVRVVVNSIKSKPFKVRVKSHPHIESVDLLAAPPEQPLVITGSGFSKDVSRNIVKFGSIKAQIISANESSITCIIPEMHFPQWYVPIKVITDGMPSKDNVYIHVDVRVIPNEGIPMH